MIYECKLELERKVNFSKLEWPSKRILETADGLMDNHEYTDMRGASWENFDACYSLERKLVKRAKKKAKTAEEFDELLRDPVDRGIILGNEDELDLATMEAGIASSVIAISALGCAPISSCRGHPNNRIADIPFVSFFARPKVARNLYDLARETGLVGMANYRLEERRGLILYSTSVEKMLDFSRQIRERLAD